MCVRFVHDWTSCSLNFPITQPPNNLTTQRARSSVVSANGFLESFWADATFFSSWPPIEPIQFNNRLGKPGFGRQGRTPMGMGPIVWTCLALTLHQGQVEDYFMAKRGLLLPIKKADPSKLQISRHSSCSSQKTEAKPGSQWTKKRLMYRIS